MSHHRRARLGVLATLLVTGAMAGSATAATTNVSFNISTYPAGFYGPDATNSTGSYSGGVSSPTANQGAQDTQQVRGGAVVSSNDIGTVTIQPGDVFNVVARSTGAVLATTTYAGDPAFDPTTCIGQNGFSGTRATDADIGVSLVQSTKRGNSRYSYYTADRTSIGHVRTLGAGTFAGALEPRGRVPRPLLERRERRQRRRHLGDYRQDLPGSGLPAAGSAGPAGG